MNRRFRKMIAIAGVWMPLLVFIFIALLSVLAPGYDFLSEYVSVLGSPTSPFAQIFNFFGFGIFGLMMILFAWALSDMLESNHSAEMASHLFIAGGIFVMLLGFFSIDLDYATATFGGRLHSLFGAFAFILLSLSILWYAVAFRASMDWGEFWMIISVILGTCAGICGAAIEFFPRFYYNGTIERLGIGAVLLWMFFVSANMLAREEFAVSKTVD